MLTTRGPKLLHGGEPRSVANVDATPNATATAHPRASRGRAIASKFRRLRALQNQIQPMALKAQHTISKLRKKLIRVVLVAPEKRLLAVVLTAAVSSRSSSQCKRPVFVMLLPRRGRGRRGRKPTRTQRILPNAFWPGGNKKKARSNTNNQASSTYLESLGTMRIADHIAPRKRARH